MLRKLGAESRGNFFLLIYLSESVNFVLEYKGQTLSYGTLFSFGTRKPNNLSLHIILSIHNVCLSQEKWDIEGKMSVDHPSNVSNTVVGSMVLQNRDNIFSFSGCLQQHVAFINTKIRVGLLIGIITAMITICIMHIMYQVLYIPHSI